MTVEKAEKEFIEALDKSMGNLYARGDWYKRKTVRMAFRKGWQRAMEQVNNCDTPAVSKCVETVREDTVYCDCPVSFVDRIETKRVEYCRCGRIIEQ